MHRLFALLGFLATLFVLFAVTLVSANPAQAAVPKAAQKMVALARIELRKGVREIPDGSNRSPHITRYLVATAGAFKGAPWCAYFVSYLAARSGTPIGPGGRGLGYVPYIKNWAKSTGRWKLKPRPGDLIMFPQHVGMVETVSRASLTSIEGNANNAVRRRYRRHGEASGYVRLAGVGSYPKTRLSNKPIKLPKNTPKKPTSKPKDPVINQPLIPRIKVYPDIIRKPGEEFNLTSNDSSGNIKNVSWDLNNDGNFESHGDSVSVKYRKLGDYLVTLKVVGHNGKTKYAREVLKVLDTPPAAVIHIEPENPKLGETVRFRAEASDEGGEIVKYEWDVDGDGKFGGSGASHSIVYKKHGDYTATLRVTDDGGLKTEARRAIRIAIPGTPVAKAACGASTLDSLKYLNCWDDGSKAEYGSLAKKEWDMNGDGIYEKSSSSASYKYTSPGTYTLSYRVTDEFGQVGYTEKVIKVNNQLPSAKITRPSSYALNFEATSSSDPDGQIVSYEWDTDNDTQYDTSGAKLTLEQLGGGTHKLRLRVTDNSGGQATASYTFTIANQAPSARFTLPSPALTGTPLVFDATESSDPDGLITTYQWDLNGNGSYESTGMKPTYTYTTPGTYNVKLKVTDAGGTTNSLTKQLVVAKGPNQAPTAQITLPLNAHYNGTTNRYYASDSVDTDGTISQYEWDFNSDGTFDKTTTYTSTSYNYSTPGNYTITLKVTDNEGASDTKQASITITDPLAGNGNNEDKASGRPVSASSEESSYYAPYKAVDTSTTSRWSSSYTNNQWISVDLGSLRKVNGVVLNWQTAYAKRYQILISDDNLNWRLALEESINIRGYRKSAFETQSARYVRILGLERDTSYGISLYEFKVFGPQD